jgi:hypothetical protein
VIPLFERVLQVDEIFAVSVLFGEGRGVVLIMVAPLERAFFGNLVQVLEVFVEGAGLRIYERVAENELFVF